MTWDMSYFYNAATWALNLIQSPVGTFLGIGAAAYILIRVIAAFTKH